MRASHRVALALAFFFLGWWLLPGRPGLAEGPPHNFSKGISCFDCHKMHSAPGGRLTAYLGNVNLCQSCHKSGGMANLLILENVDQATPGTLGKHHRWDATAVNATYQTDTPLNSSMAARLESGKIMCSTCHDQHSQAKKPMDPMAFPNGTFTAGVYGNHYQRIDNQTNQMCKDCHRARDIQSVRTYTGNKLSHPVGVTVSSVNTPMHSVPYDVNGVAQAVAGAGGAYPLFSKANSAGSTTTLNDTTKSWTPNALVGLVIRFTSGSNKNLIRTITANTATQIQWSAALSVATANGHTYEVDADGNVTNNLRLDNNGTPSYAAGMVQCMSCHGPHFSDSNSSTYDRP